MNTKLTHTFKVNLQCAYVSAYDGSFSIEDAGGDVLNIMGVSADQWTGALLTFIDGYLGVDDNISKVPAWKLRQMRDRLNSLAEAGVLTSAS